MNSNACCELGGPRYHNADCQNARRPWAPVASTAQPGRLQPGGFQPFKCPVCMGVGSVPKGFYDIGGGNILASSTAAEMCRYCGGRGVVWREET